MAEAHSPRSPKKFDAYDVEATVFAKLRGLPEGLRDCVRRAAPRSNGNGCTEHCTLIRVMEVASRAMVARHIAFNVVG